MTKEELKRTKLFANSILTAINNLEKESEQNKKLDLNISESNLSENLMNYIMSDKWKKELTQLRNEKIKQEQMINDAWNWIQKNVQIKSQNYFSENVTRYPYFYLIELTADHFTNGCFIFDKNGNLFYIHSHVSSLTNSVYDADDNNFFITESIINPINKKSELQVYHYQTTPKKIELVNIINGITSTPDTIIGRGFDSKNDNTIVENPNCLIAFTSKTNNYFLYNYQRKEVMIPDYYALTKSLYHSNLYQVKHIIYSKELELPTDKYLFNSETPRTILEFAINKEGILITDVYDFENEIIYTREGRGNTQQEILENIYKEAQEHLDNSLSKSNKTKQLKPSPNN